MAYPVLEMPEFFFTRTIFIFTPRYTFSSMLISRALSWKLDEIHDRSLNSLDRGIGGPTSSLMAKNHPEAEFEIEIVARQTLAAYIHRHDI